MHVKNKGFTLIELMIVIAIIGILSSIAISAYQDHIARSQVAEALSLMSGVKGPMIEFHSMNGTCINNNGKKTENTQNSSSVAKDTEIYGKYVKRVRVARSNKQDNGCAIWAEMRSSGVNKNIAGKQISLRMTPTSGSYQFSCASSFDIKYTPSALKCTYSATLNG